MSRAFQKYTTCGWSGILTTLPPPLGYLMVMTDPLDLGHGKKSYVKVHQLYNLSLTYLKHVLVHTDSIQNAGAALFHTGISMSLIFNSNTKQFQILSILTWDFRVASVKTRLYFLFLTNPNGRHWTVSSNRIQGVSHEVLAVAEITSTE